MIQEAPQSDLLSPSHRALHHDLSSPSARFDALHATRYVDDGLGRLKQYPCENCDKEFADSAELQRHIRGYHVGARSHTCSDCGKTFATSSGLKQHQHIHSSVKPFQCEVCLKAYTQFSNLCRHKRMHADCRQQIKCKDCGQTFSTMTSLGKHKRFCQGMQLSNGTSRLSAAAGSYGGSTPTLASEKVSGSNSAKLSAFSSPYSVPFYAHRPPFPFFPPVGPGFPMFSPGHPVTAMLPTSLSELSKRKSCDDPEDSDYKKPEVLDRYDGGEEKMSGRYKWSSDHSNVSNSSDAANKSDLDSEGESERAFHNGLSDGHRRRPVKTSSPTNLASPVPITKETNMAYICSKANGVEPFNLAKGTNTSTPAAEKTSSVKSTKTPSSGGEQPLDLSGYRSHVDKEETPRKTHIFGSHEKPTPAAAKEKVSPIAKPKALSPAAPHHPLSPKVPKSPIESPERSMHEAYATRAASHAMLSRMYGSGLEKTNLEAYQEAARYMSMAPSRFAFPGVPTPYNPFGSAAMPSIFPHHPHMEHHAKGLTPQSFLRGANGSSFPPYAPSMNKLKDRYACKFCGKIFPRSANLTRHLRTHTGEQPYKCKYCERSFSISSNLQRHIRNIHNKEKPFKCPICDRSFGQQTNLDRHLKKHEFEGPIVADSPSNEDHDCCDDVMGEMLNPGINSGELGSTGSSGHTSDLSSPTKEDKEASAVGYSPVHKLSEPGDREERVSSRRTSSPKHLDDSLGASEDDGDWAHGEDEMMMTEDDAMGDMEDEDALCGEEDPEDSHHVVSSKRAKLLNNNLPDEGYNSCVVNLSSNSH